MPSLLLSRRDVEFLLYEWLDVELLTKRERYAEHSRDTFDAVLDLAEEIATDHFAPHNRKADLNEPYVGDDGKVVLIPEVAVALRHYADAGLIGASMDEAVGGMQLPYSVSGFAMAYFQAANVGTCVYPFLTIGNANLLTAHGSAEVVETYVKPMVEGRFFGTMCLSEPQAGSSLTDVTTRAERSDDGNYRLFGNKMWISGGEHELSENIIHLVLARVPGAPLGVKGLSLFVVPKFIISSGEHNDVVLAGLNHKMGYRGGTNTLLNFGEGKFTPDGKPGAIGYLVGEENKGLAYMFHMMNEARVGVGLGATALGYTGYLHSLDYAKSRPQGRPIAAKDPASAQVPIIDHADVRRMLLAQKSYAEGALALNAYCGKLLDEELTAETAEERDRAKLLLDMLTPIAKSWPSQWCLEANSLAIQVLGGAGYTRDYPVEQFYRDNRLNPIHEGTHGIQGMDLLGRKAIMQGGAGLKLLLDTMRENCDDSSYGVALAAALDRVAAVTVAVWTPGDPELALANASIYLEVVGHVVLSWIWLSQFQAAEGKTGAFYDGKRAATAYFFGYELPKTGPQFDLLERLDRTTLDLEASWF